MSVDWINSLGQESEKSEIRSKLQVHLIHLHLHCLPYGSYLQP
jgi:hypothetical protein